MIVVGKGAYELPVGFAPKSVIADEALAARNRPFLQHPHLAQFGPLHEPLRGWALAVRFG